MSHLPLSFTTGKIDQVEFTDSYMIPSLVALCTLDHDGKDGMGAGGGLVHQSSTHGSVLFSSLHDVVNF